MAGLTKWMRDWGAWVRLILTLSGMLIIMWFSNQAAVATNAKDIMALKDQVKEINDQKLGERQATTEQAIKDIDERLGRIETGQGKMLDRMNEIADKK